MPIKSPDKRRDFLKVGGVVGALGVLGTGVVKWLKNTQDSAGVVMPVPTELAPKEEFDLKNVGSGVTLLISKKDGLPEFYGVDGGKDWLPIDKEALFEVQQEAKKNGEVEVGLYVDVPEVVNEKLYDGVDRSIENLPEYVATDEELKKCGIEIIQANSTELHISKAALEEGGIFEQNGAWRDRINSGVEDTNDIARIGHRLIIAVLDSGFVSTNALVGDKYKKVRDLLGTELPTIIEPGEYRQAKLQSLRDSLEQAKRAGDASDLNSAGTSIKMMIINYEKATDDQLVLEQSHLGADSYGKVYPLTMLVNENEGRNYGLMLLPAGNSKSLNKLVIMFSPDGKFGAKVVESFSGADLRPRPEMGDMDPDARGVENNQRILINPFAAEHEGAHWSGQGDEKEADKKAWDTLRKAHKKLKDENDGSGYTFVWKLPNDRWIRG